MISRRHLKNIVRLFNPELLGGLSRKELAEYQKYLVNVRSVVFTIGFSKSGSSFTSYLLTAHPNIVMSNEANVIKRYLNQEIVTRESFLCQMIKADMTRKHKKYSKYVLDEYGHCHYNRIEVIGDKSSSENTKSFSETSSNLEEIQEMIGLPVLFIFNVRNPYDMTTSLLTTVPRFCIKGWHENAQQHIEEVVSIIEELSEKNKSLLEQIPAHRVFISRHETLIDNPKAQLIKICDFLNVDKPDDYLSVCASVTYKSPNKCRDRIDWPEEFKRRVEKLTKNYEFFSGYTWEA